MTIEKLLAKYWLLEDAPHGDITSDILPDMEAIAQIISKDEGIVFGVKLAKEIIEELHLKTKILKQDGERIKPSDVIMEISGNIKKILLVERLILNLIMFLSGIATTTAKLIEKVKKINPKIKITATRKTIPGLRWASKQAVKIGGGDTHRMGLSDCYLIKDNHIKIIGSIEKAISLAKEKASFTKKIEIEVTTIEQAIEAAKAGADIIMFDNMKPTEIKKAIQKLRELGLRKKVILEVSGGITPENIDKYAELDIDIISTSKITLSPKPIDLTLKVKY